MNRLFRLLDRFSSLDNERPESMMEEDNQSKILACSVKLSEDQVEEKNVDVSEKTFRADEKNIRLTLLQHQIGTYYWRRNCRG